MGWAIVLLVGGTLAIWSGRRWVRRNQRTPLDPALTGPHRTHARLERWRSWEMVIGGCLFVALAIGAIVRGVGDSPVWSLDPPYAVTVENRCDDDAVVRLADRPGQIDDVAGEPLPAGSTLRLTSDGRVDGDASGDVVDVRFSGSTELPSGGTVPVEKWVSRPVEQLDFRRAGSAWKATLLIAGDDCSPM